MKYTLHISVLLEMVYGLPHKLFGGLWNYRHITNSFGHVSFNFRKESIKHKKKYKQAASLIPSSHIMTLYIERSVST